MSSERSRIVMFVLRDNFGPVVCEVAKPLQWGPKSLASLSAALNGEYPQHTIRETLIFLLQHDFVSAVYDDHSPAIQYRLNFDRVLLVLRYPRCLSAVKRKLGADYAELVETLFCLGRAPVSKIVEESIRMHGKADDAYGDCWTKCVQLIKDRYLKRTATYVVCVEVDPKKMFVPPTRRQNDERQILFVPNFDRFHQRIGDKIIVDAVVRTLDDPVAGEVMSVVLDQCEHSIYAPVSNSVSLHSIRTNLTVGSEYLLEYLTMIEEDPTNFIFKSTGTNCMINVNFKQIFNSLNDSMIDQIVSYNYGESSVRLFRAVKAKKLADPDNIQQTVLLPDKLTRTLMNELFINNYLQVQELGKSLSQKSSKFDKQFHLYHVNDRLLHQQLTEEIMKMIGNCMMWKFKTFEDNKRLLKNKNRFDDMVRGLEDQRDVDSNFVKEGMDGLFSPSEQILLGSISRLMRQCQLNIMRLDQCLFLLNSCKEYNKKK